MQTTDPLADFLRQCEAHCQRTGMGRAALSHALFDRGSRLDELAGRAGRESSLSIRTFERAKKRLADLARAAPSPSPTSEAA